jgi:antagonist of KipI
MTTIIIEKAGILDTLQDGGRFGYGHLGINPNGPMDWHAHQLANILVGNQPWATAMEIHFPAPILRFVQPALIVITGADFEAMINNQSVPPNRPVVVPAGARLQFLRKKQGERAYLALQGRCQVPAVLGSCSTNLVSGFGGLQGRKLMSGDRINYDAPVWSDPRRLLTMPWFAAAQMTQQMVRVMPGPEWEWLTPASQQAMLEKTFYLQSSSNRMALQWDGPPLACLDDRQLLSSAVDTGTMQLLPNGKVLTLMADHQTVGGYPRVLQVIAADLPVLAQLSAGQPIRFVQVSVEAACESLLLLQQDLSRIAIASRLQLEAMGKG